ncbi:MULTISPECIES: Rz1-like lysis system protein LysC [unclassified Serratia (in: enterobacteria)]|uniref:Rz1-like lysis system protein LysC n=1 Tax=unclassified Serratia (in: enterobacteria) TaxID=2647522 RepID=UPI001E542A89|nr:MULTISPECIES: Rz1-like lysis system protein LysC [unclassified Serratia (in: enterobacteria)]
MLSGCTVDPPLPTPTIIYAGCPKISSCPIPESSPTTNGALSEDVRQLERALVSCAQQVEVVKQCQEKLDVEAEKLAQSAE